MDWVSCLMMEIGVVDALPGILFELRQSFFTDSF